MRYSPRDLDIVWECMDGESLLIDLKKGVYYSFRAGTSQLLIYLLSGRSFEEIKEEMLERFDALEGGQLEQRIHDLVGMLLADELVVEDAQRSRDEPDLLELDPLEFPAPEKFDDMTEIFEMDPIHDGDLERGWPVQSTP